MARVCGAICVFILIIGVLVLENRAEGLVVSPPRGRLIAKPDRKCMNFIFFEPCQENYVCNNSLTVKLHRKTSHTASTLSSSISNNQIMKFNRIYLLCIFDSSAGENISCCKDLLTNPNISITVGYDAGLSHEQEISFDLQACNTTCLTMKNFFKAVLPWYDPCYFEKPCQNLGQCQPAFNAYTCKCFVGWNGTNCTIPSDMMLRADQCLDYYSSSDVKLYMKTVGECRIACFYNRGISSCKAFEFKKMVSSNQGNCTLRSSNSLGQKVQSCDMDLYEFTSFLVPSTPRSHSAPTVVAAGTLYLLLAYLACFLM